MRVWTLTVSSVAAPALACILYGTAPILSASAGGLPARVLLAQVGGVNAPGSPPGGPVGTTSQPGSVYTVTPPGSVMPSAGGAPAATAPGDVMPSARTPTAARENTVRARNPYSSSGSVDQTGRAMRSQRRGAVAPRVRDRGSMHRRAPQRAPQRSQRR